MMAAAFAVPNPDFNTAVRPAYHSPHGSIPSASYLTHMQLLRLRRLLETMSSLLILAPNILTEPMPRGRLAPHTATMLLLEPTSLRELTDQGGHNHSSRQRSNSKRIEQRARFLRLCYRIRVRPCSGLSCRIPLVGIPNGKCCHCPFE